MIGPEQLAAGQRAETAGDYVAAAAAYTAVTAVADESLAVQAHFCLGRVSWRQGRFDAALKSFENARAIAARSGDVEFCARVDNGIGAVHYARGDYTSARQLDPGLMASVPQGPASHCTSRPTISRSTAPPRSTSARP